MGKINFIPTPAITIPKSFNHIKSKNIRKFVKDLYDFQDDIYTNIITENDKYARELYYNIINNIRLFKPYFHLDLIPISVINESENLKIIRDSILKNRRKYFKGLRSG